MKHFTLIIIALLSSLLNGHAQDLTGAESTIKEKIDTYLVELYKGNLDVYANLFAEDGVYYFESNEIAGQEAIRNAFAELNFPQVEYTHKILHIRKYESVYLVTYQVTEADDFRYENTEIWEQQGGEYKIAYAKFNEIGRKTGMQPPLFFAGIVLFGFFLFALLLVFRKAKNYKALKK